MSAPRGLTYNVYLYSVAKEKLWKAICQTFHFLSVMKASNSQHTVQTI